MTSRRFGLTPRLAACAIAGLELAAANRAFAQAADLVFVNGKVFTADARSSLAEGFAVRGDRFIAVGPSAAMQEHVGPGSRVIDLHGRFVTPGLADGHLHNEGGGPGVDLSSARSLSDLLDAVGRAAKDTTPGKPIISNNDWHEAQLREQRLPTGGSWRVGGGRGNCDGLAALPAAGRSAGTLLGCGNRRSATSAAKADHGHVSVASRERQRPEARCNDYSYTPVAHAPGSPGALSDSGKTRRC